VTTAFSQSPEIAGGGIGALRRYLATRHLLELCFRVALFLWPFELPIAMTAHGIVKPTLGEWYGLLFHGTALTGLSLALLASGRWRARWIAGDLHCFAYLALVYVALGVAALPVSSLGPLQMRFSYQQLVCGYLAPILAMAALLTLSPRSQGKAWLAFFAGWIAYLLASFALLYVSWSAAGEIVPSLADRSLAERLLLWRFTLSEEWNIYGTFIGNSNKTSNYLVMFLLLSVTLLGVGGPRLSALSRVTLGAFWLTACITLVLLFSRAALLLLPVVIVCSGILTAMPRRLLVMTAASFVVGLGVIAVLEPRIFQYLFAAQLVEDMDANPLGTFLDRFEQWSALARYLAENPLQMLFGLGTTGYGVQFFGNGEAGTHNFLLDLWVESGLFGVGLFVVFLGLLCFQIATARKRWQDRGLLGVALLTLGMLMTREHSVSYLYVTGMGGLCVIVISYLAVAPARRQSGE
jgi:O-antigen ligase